MAVVSEWARAGGGMARGGVGVTAEGWSSPAMSPPQRSRSRVPVNSQEESMGSMHCFLDGIRLDAETMRRLFDRIVAMAVNRQVTRGRKMRVDTIVVEAPM
jgi:hypothetical protein